MAEQMSVERDYYYKVRLYGCSPLILFTFVIFLKFMQTTLLYAGDQILLGMEKKGMG